MNPTEMPQWFGRNTASNIVLSVVFVAVAVVTTPLLTHHLGHVRYGIWVLVLSVVQYLKLLEVGFAGATVTCIARHYAPARTRHSSVGVINEQSHPRPLGRHPRLSFLLRRDSTPLVPGRVTVLKRVHYGSSQNNSRIRTEPSMSQTSA